MHNFRPLQWVIQLIKLIVYINVEEVDVQTWHKYNQYEPIKYRLLEIYQQYDIANLGKK